VFLYQIREGTCQKVSEKEKLKINAGYGRDNPKGMDSD